MYSVPPLTVVSLAVPPDKSWKPPLSVAPRTVAPISTCSVPPPLIVVKLTVAPVYTSSSPPLIVVPMAAPPEIYGLEAGVVHHGAGGRARRRTHTRRRRCSPWC